MTYIPYPLIQIHNHYTFKMDLKFNPQKPAIYQKWPSKKINWLNSLCTWYMHYVFSSSPINYIATCKTIGIRQVHKHLGNDAASLLYLFIYHSSVTHELKYFYMYISVYFWFYTIIKDTCTCTLSRVIW